MGALILLLGGNGLFGKTAENISRKDIREEMELCSIEDAFPNIGTVARTIKGSGFPYVGGLDDKASREERRAARKRAKQLAKAGLTPVQTYVEATKDDVPDPDALVIQRASLAVEPFQAEDPVAPVPALKPAPAKIPVLPKASCLFSDTGYPSYFGKGEEDDVEEGYFNYSAGTGPDGDDSAYRLEPDFTKTFDFKGVQKAAGGALPVPNLEDGWKPMTSGAPTYTAYTTTGTGPAPKADALWSLSYDEPVLPPAVAPGPTGDLKRKGPVQVPTSLRGIEEVESSSASSVLPVNANKAEDRDKLLARIDGLMGRLEMLEKKRTQDTQTELLAFIGTGLFLLLSLELVVRRR